MDILDTHTILFYFLLYNIHFLSLLFNIKHEYISFLNNYTFSVCFTLRRFNNIWIPFILVSY